VDIGSAVGVLAEFNCFGARLSSLAQPKVKESRMRVKKRVKKGVKKGIKSVKAAPPQAYLVGAGVLVGAAAVLLLTTTQSGRELLLRTAQLTLRPEADKPESEESDVQEQAQREPAEDADVEEKPEEDTKADDETQVADLKPRIQRPRSHAPGRVAADA
jgi:hypothetical protein